MKRSIYKKSLGANDSLGINKTAGYTVPWNSAKETGGTLITINGKAQNQSVSIENYVINTYDN